MDSGLYRTEVSYDNIVCARLLLGGQVSDICAYPFLEQIDFGESCIDGITQAFRLPFLEVIGDVTLSFLIRSLANPQNGENRFFQINAASIIILQPRSGKTVDLLAGIGKESKSAVWDMVKLIPDARMLSVSEYYPVAWLALELARCDLSRLNEFLGFPIWVHCVDELPKAVDFSHTHLSFDKIRVGSQSTASLFWKFFGLSRV
jgi:hypothetical protein